MKSLSGLSLYTIQIQLVQRYSRRCRLTSLFCDTILYSKVKYACHKAIIHYQVLASMWLRHDYSFSLGRRFCVLVFSFFVLGGILWGVVGVGSCVGIMLCIISSWSCGPVVISWIGITCGRLLPSAACCCGGGGGSGARYACLSRMRCDHGAWLIWRVAV